MSFDHAKEVLYASMRNSFPLGAAGDAECMDWVEGRKLTQGEVRLEVELDTLTGNYKFGVNPQDQNTNNIKFPTEQRLKQQDTLIINEYGFFLGAPTSREDTEFDLMTFPDQVVFSAAELRALKGGLYSNGSYQLNVNGDVVIPYRGLFNHLHIPQTQHTDALGAGSPQNEINGAEDAAITQEANLLLIGSKNNVPQVNLARALSSCKQYTRLVLIYRGILAQNATVVG